MSEARRKVIEYFDQRYIPPFASLITFERVAFYSSITRAANDVGKTPSAVSRSIRELEARLNCKLFRKEGKKFLLTSEGSYYLCEVRKALDILKPSSNPFSESEKIPVSLHAPPLFIETVILPNIGDFNHSYPNIQLNINCKLNENSSWLEDNIDIEIRTCGKLDSMLDTERLGILNTVPICSPDLLPNRKQLTNIEELENFPLLHLSLFPQAWSHWLQLSDYSGVKSSQNLTFNSAAIILNAVKNRVGIGLAHHSYVTQSPDYNKDFTVVFDNLDVGYLMSYNCVWRKNSSKKTEIKLVNDWLKYAFDKTHVSAN